MTVTKMRCKERREPIYGVTFSDCVMQLELLQPELITSDLVIVTNRVSLEEVGNVYEKAANDGSVTASVTSLYKRTKVSG